MFLNEQENFVEQVSKTLKLIANPVRLQVLCDLMEGRKNVTELLSGVKISQSALSQHLQALKKEGIILDEKENKFIYYKLQNPQVLAILKSLKKICK
jgi:DNA-binding transcriptional ArsR family regulator